MPTRLSINDSATWRHPAYIAVNDAGTWRHIGQILVNDGGAWRIVTPYYNDVTVGDLTGGNYGYSTGTPITAGGALLFQPSINLSANYGLGNISTILAIWSGLVGATSRDFVLHVGQGSSNQSAFSEIIVQDDAGTIRSYTSASAASYGQGAGQGQWAWGSGASPVWTAATVGGLRWICIMP